MRCTTAVLPLLLLALPVQGQEIIERDFDANGIARIEIDLRGAGSITVIGDAGEKARCTVAFHRTDPDDFRFTFDRRDDSLVIGSRRFRQVQRTDIRLEIHVPRRSDLDLRTAGGGITLRGIEGTIRGRTAGGVLNLSDLHGTIALHSAGGEITLRDSALDGRVTTGGGPVLVENVTGDIEADSGGGAVVYRNVTTPYRTYPAEAVYIRNAGGAIDVDEAPGGADVRTGGGDIWINSAGEYVRASTGGGDIRINAIDGRVEASTGAGDIRVTMTGDPARGERDVTLRTGYGDVWLTVPDGLSMRVEIEAGFTRGHERDARIIDEFGLEVTESEEWDDSQGTPRKIRYGRLVTGEGEHLIKIRTTNGTVHLRRGG